MPLKEVARVLAANGLSALPVLDPDDRVIGVVSERDLLSKPIEQVLKEMGDGARCPHMAR